MKIIEVPVFNDDGSIKFTSLIDAEQSKALLGFALNFLTAAGMATTIAVARPDDDEDDSVQIQRQLDD